MGLASANRRRGAAAVVLTGRGAGRHDRANESRPGSAGARRDVSMRSHRGERREDHGLMYWNSDMFCSCA